MITLISDEFSTTEQCKNLLLDESLFSFKKHKAFVESKVLEMLLTAVIDEVRDHYEDLRSLTNEQTDFSDNSIIAIRYCINLLNSIFHKCGFDFYDSLNISKDIDIAKAISNEENYEDENLELFVEFLWEYLQNHILEEIKKDTASSPEKVLFDNSYVYFPTEALCKFFQEKHKQRLLDFGLLYLREVSKLKSNSSNTFVYKKMLCGYRRNYYCFERSIMEGLGGPSLGDFEED